MPPHVPTPFTDLDTLRQWLAARPWLNIEQTGAEILEKLAVLDQTPLATEQCARILELYHPYLVEYTATLEKHLLDAAIPLSPSNRAIANLLLALCQRMGSNFSRVVFSPDFIASDSFTSDERRDLLLQTIDWLSRLDLHYAQIYRKPGNNYWRTIYRLYKLSETAELFPPGSAIQTEIQGHVARILLFNVVTPQRFRPREMKQIDLLLQRFAPLAKCHHQSTLGKHKAVFFFDSHTPSPPKPIKLLGQVTPPPTTLNFLFPQGVARALLKFVSSNESQDLAILPFHQVKKLALQLARIYSAPKRRKWRRLEEEGNCQLVVGIEELLTVLVAQDRIPEDLFELLPNNQEPKETEDLLQEDFELIPLEDEIAGFHEEHRSESEVFWELLDGRNKISSRDIWSPDNSTGRGEKKNRYPGRFANSSAQGYCLIWLDHTREKLKVGEIIGIIHTMGEVEIGAIRWLKQEAKQAIAVGVELLSFAVSGVIVYQHMLDDLHAEGKRELGLLLPPQPALQKSAGLLAPTHSWQQGQWVKIYRNKSTHDIFMLQQLVDSTPVYDLFSLAPLS